MADSSRRQHGKEARQYVDRNYRDFSARAALTAFSVQWKETDLYIRAQRDLSREAMEAVLLCRGVIEAYIRSHPAFQSSLEPLPPDPGAPPLIRAMLDAAVKARVGPMAGVAGAVAEQVGRALMAHTGEVIVENGGDIFLCAERPVTVSIFSGASPLCGKVGIRIRPGDMPCGVCTSSGTVGPSLSFGSADAVTVRAASTILADGVATALGNRISRPDDIEPVLESATVLEGVQGAVAILGDRIGIWGDVDIVRLTGEHEQGNDT